MNIIFTYSNKLIKKNNLNVKVNKLIQNFANQY